jgi:hypothetical protein
MTALPGEMWARLALAILATWRVTHLLAAEDGPADVIFRVRRSLGQGWLASLADCFNCLSLFVAAPAALFVSQRPLVWAFAWLAVSGGACLLQRMGETAPLADPLIYSMEGDADVLQRETLDDPPAGAPSPPGAADPGSGPAP